MTVIHGTLLLGFHVQPVVEPVTENRPLLAGPETLFVTGAMVSEQAAPPCVSENVCVAILIVPVRDCPVGFEATE